MNAKVVGKPKVVEDPQGNFRELVFQVDLEGCGHHEVSSRVPDGLSVQGLKTFEETNAVLAAVKSYLADHPEVMTLYPQTSCAVNGPAQITLSAPAFETLAQTIGKDLLLPFITCFMYMDRLTSLAELLYLTYEKFGDDSISAHRNRVTVLSLASGTLIESAKTVEQLKEANIVERLSERKSWDELWNWSERLKRNDWFGVFHKKVGVHIDQDLLEIGLDKVMKNHEHVTVFETEEDANCPTRFPIGWQLLEKGLPGSLELKNKGMAMKTPDITALNNLVHLSQRELQKLLPKVFNQLLKDSGIKAGA